MDNKRKLEENPAENEMPTQKKRIIEFQPSVKNIQTLADLITISKEWIDFKGKLKKGNKNEKIRHELIIKKYMDYEKISNIRNHLENLNNLIGMKELKKNIVNQILFFTQDLHHKEMMHTVLTGQPGVGKTVVAQILGNIYKDLGMLKKGTFKIAQRADFVGEYLGSTSIKTKKLLESCIGGVLFIDEAYSLGNKEKRDSFAKESIDTLNQFLSEHTDNFICIIAGYEHSLNECFFSWNEGLERRFPWKFNLTKYSSSELKDILLYQITNNGWLHNISNDDLLDITKQNEALFTSNGGDCLLYFDKCKIYHARRVFGSPVETKFILTKEDFVEGMKLFKEFKSKKQPENIPIGIYL